MNEQRGGPLKPPHHLHHVTLADDPPSITDSRVSSHATHRQQQVAREAERLMPLTRYYGPRPLLDVTIGQLYVRGRWAA